MKKYLDDEEAHKAINTKFSKRLFYLNDNLYEVDSAQSKVERN